jgi:hypothetical protein
VKSVRNIIVGIFVVSGLVFIGLGFTGGLLSLTYFIVGGSLLFTALIWLMVGQMFGPSKLLTTGLPATGVVTGLRETGTVINNTNQVLHVGLRVQVGNGAPYDVVVKQAIPMMLMSRIQPGATVGVRVDPHDQTKAAIDFSMVPGVNMGAAPTAYTATPPSAYAQPQAPAQPAAYPQAPAAYPNAAYPPAAYPAAPQTPQSGQV